MKTTTTQAQIETIIKTLHLIHVQTFETKSGDAKSNAQRNLSGRTHYVDDDTLRWHKSRVLGAKYLHDGLLFRVTCSDALDMNNTKRGFRCVVFDVFGTCVSRPELENATATRQAAINASEHEEIDLVAHYTQAIARKIEELNREAVELNQAKTLLAA